MIVSLYLNLTSFSLCKSHFIQLIFFYSFLTNIDSYFDRFIFVLLYIFYFLDISFLSWCFDASCGLPVYFLFFNYPIFFIFAPNFRHSWLETTNVFCHSPLWIALKEFYHPFYCFNGQFFGWRNDFFQLGMPNHLLRFVRTVC